MSMRIVLTVCIAWSVSAASVHAQAAGDPELESLRKALAEARRALAETRLEVNRIMRELEELRAFVTTPDVEEQMLAWRRERQDLSNQRQGMEADRRRLEQMKLTVRDAARAGAAAPAKNDGRSSGASAPTPVSSEPKPEIDYQVALIPKDIARQSVFVSPLTGLALLGEVKEDVDRRNIRLRGTLQNRSTGSWRYTFEIRLGGPAAAGGRAPIIGRWRYQTPVLGPNELHAFEFKVPVTDVSHIVSYQIGNIESDPAN